MNVKFRITFEDGSTLESHDKDWNLILDHAQALPPFNNKLWVSYELMCDDTGPATAGVNFKTGCFQINGQEFQPSDPNLGVLTFAAEPQAFLGDETRKYLNQLPYFPIFGRRYFKGDRVDAVIYLCGWKRKFGEKLIEHTLQIYPNGKVVFE